MAGRQLLDAPQNREWRWQAAKAEIGGQATGVDGAGEAGEGTKGGEFRGEDQQVPGGGTALDTAPVERLLAEAVPSKLKQTVLSIPKSKSKHAHTAVERGLQPPSLDGREEGFGIGMATPGPSELIAGFELAAEVKVVIDLAVERQHKPTGGTGHGLVPRGGEVKNGQAAMDKSQAGDRITPDACVIGSTMGQGIRHGASARLQDFSGRGGWLPKAGQAAH
jgi:hypothetical protein